MTSQLTVDFNRVVRDDLIRANARRAVPGTDLSVGATVIVGDDEWGVAPAKVVEYDEATGAVILKVLAELHPERAGAISRKAERCLIGLRRGAGRLQCGPKLKRPNALHGLC